MDLWLTCSNVFGMLLIHVKFPIILNHYHPFLAQSVAKLDPNDRGGGSKTYIPKNFYRTGESKTYIPKNFYTKIHI
ncbi:hypothetical protein Hanom_Chr12g01174181 [Helianthus anomalus]